MSSRIGRRSFLKSSGAAGAAAVAWQIVPRHVLGAGQTPPSEKLNVASIGVGGQGRGGFWPLAETAGGKMGGILDGEPRQKNLLQTGRDRGVPRQAEKKQGVH